MGTPIVSSEVTASEKVAVAVWGVAAESMTWTLKLVVPPDPLGVPLMTPAGLSMRPAGKDEPLAKLHV